MYLLEKNIVVYSSLVTYCKCLRLVFKFSKSEMAPVTESVRTLSPILEW